MLLTRPRKDDHSLHKDEDLEAVRAVLALPRKQRSSQQIQLLARYTQHVKLFSDMQQDVQTHWECCSCLTGEVYSANKYVFRQGDPGNNFYIILKGSCAVQISGKRSDGTMEQRLLTVLRQGECFGELALLSSQPRQASIQCREDCHFAVLSRDDYNRILSKAHERIIHSKVTILIKQPIFRKLSKGALTRLTYFFKIKTYLRKQTVFNAGDPATELFIVKDGDFQLTKAVEMPIVQAISPPNTTKSRRCSVNVTLLGTGEILGSSELIHGKFHAYTCTCYSTTGELMAINKSDFLQLLGSEEVLKYLDNLHLTKETDRVSRIATATGLRKSMDTVSARPVASLLTGISGKSHPSSTQSTKHSHTLSAVIPKIPQPEYVTPKSRKPTHKGKSWSQICLQKYSLTDKSLVEVRPKTKRIVNYHTFSLKDLKRSRSRGAQKGGGYSWGSGTFGDSFVRLKLTDLSQV